jgi:hypothetical protein
MEKGKGTGNTGTPAANTAGRKKENTPGSQRGRRENEERRPQKMVWGGGNDQDWGTPGLERAKPAAARVLNTQFMLGRASQGALPGGVSGRNDEAERVAEGCPCGGFESGSGGNRVHLSPRIRPSLCPIRPRNPDSSLPVPDS